MTLLTAPGYQRFWQSGKLIALPTLGTPLSPGGKGAVAINNRDQIIGECFKKPPRGKLSPFGTHAVLWTLKR